MNGLGGESNAELFPRNVLGSGEASASPCNHRGEIAQRWESKHGKARPGVSNSGRGGESLEGIRRVAKRKAAVSGVVFVPALERLVGAAQEQRARGHQLAPERRSILKCSRGDDGDGHVRMPLFESAVSGPGGADHVFHRPSVALGQHARSGRTRSAVYGAPRQGPFQLSRNFRQELVP